MSRIPIVALALMASVTSLYGQQLAYPPGWWVLLHPEQVRPEQVVYTPEDGVALPKPIPPVVYPQYPGEAVRRKIQGKVRVEVVVWDDGTVSPDSVKVTRSVDPLYGLDDAVVRAVKQWRFTPGTKDGQPVAVRIGIDVAFSRH